MGIDTTAQVDDRNAERCESHRRSAEHALEAAICVFALAMLTVGALFGIAVARLAEAGDIAR